MKLIQPIKVKELAKLINAHLVGDGDMEVRYLSDVRRVCRGSLVFVNDEKYLNPALYSSATAIILKEIPKQLPTGKALLLVEQPFLAYNFLARYFKPFRPLDSEIDPSAKIGQGTIIEPGAVIGHNVRIGDDCLIRSNVVILDDTHIGNRVQIHPNTVIGSMGFYFEPVAEGFERYHFIGDVRIEDGVEIGANCTIDRGVASTTRIGEGTKIDNLVHISHGVNIGKHCLIAAQVGIAGKVTIQDRVTIFGQVGISKEVVIGEEAVLLSQTGVSKSIPGEMQYFGTPASEAQTSFRELAALRRLPDLLKWWQRKMQEEGREDM